MREATQKNEINNNNNNNNNKFRWMLLAILSNALVVRKWAAMGTTDSRNLNVRVNVYRVIIQGPYII